MISRSFIAMLLVGALAAGAFSAQASQPHKLTLRQVKTAIGRFAGEVGIGREREAAKEEQQQRLVFLGASLHGCEIKDGGGLCVVEYRFSSSTCVDALGALPARPTIRVVKLSAMKCEATSGNEQRYGGSPNSNPRTERQVAE